MIIDVSINYQPPKIIFQSTAANISQTRTSRIGFAKEENEKKEYTLIQHVGETVTLEETKHWAAGIPSYDGWSFYDIDPFLPFSFNVVLSLKMIEHYCRYARVTLHPKLFDWERFIFIKVEWLDKIDLILTLPEYNLVADFKREAFEKGLRKITKTFQILRN